MSKFLALLPFMLMAKATDTAASASGSSTKSDAAPNLPTATQPAVGPNPTPSKGADDSVTGSPPSEPRLPDGPTATPGQMRAEARAGKAGGPTFEEYTARGYDPATYPPKGYSEIPSEGLAAYRASGKVTTKRDALADGATHLLVRSRNDGFRRSGLRFTRDWQAVPVADLTDEQIAAIENDGMLDTKRTDARGAAEYTTADHIEDDATPTQLRQALQRERDRADVAEETVKQLRARYEGGELPPPPGRMPDGDPIR